MDHTTPVDLETWPRREQFAYYTGEVAVSYTITVEVDVTELRAALRTAGRKTYLGQVWAVAAVVNRRPEFRMTMVDGAPAVWNVVHPAFTVFNPARETFAIVWSPWDEDFAVFHDRAAEVLRTHRDAETFTPQDDLPANIVDVSSLPWTSFTGFTLHIAGGWNSLTPVFTLGKFTEREGRTLLPMAVQAHHAVADGFHTARLIEDFRALVAEPSWVGPPGHQTV
ncbi:hypothetical protein JL107_14225 [Nakamurella flavida]|uniref:Chloramphenicol acetyltransferase n=1 Tax=Nakamurella flavida TaxID=363630 RepID=A0A938YQL6_9ACTN|nr:CatA-like O-acetyltransferase [Nakamurella flavida]MBM9477604.1 hypothetical protein [Nakamurella flavida]MDP9779152.1 chloramphenicol O-acetyltransferase type A [Nakamurella flavida]